MQTIAECLRKTYYSIIDMKEESISDFFSLLYILHIDNHSIEKDCVVDVHVFNDDSELYVYYQGDYPLVTTVSPEFVKDMTSAKNLYNNSSIADSLLHVFYSLDKTDEGMFNYDDLIIFSRIMSYCSFVEHIIKTESDDIHSYEFVDNSGLYLYNYNQYDEPAYLENKIYSRNEHLMNILNNMLEKVKKKYEI